MISETARDELWNEERRLLARRLRGMLWIVIFATTLFALADLSLPAAHSGPTAAKVYVLYGLQIAITFAILGAMRLPFVERWALPVASIATAEVSLMVAALGFVTSDAVTGPLIAIMLVLTTAAFFPWGAAPQAIAAVIVLSGVFWNVFHVGGRHDAALAYPLILAILSSTASVYMAFEFGRSRLEAKLMEQDLARARDSALESSRLKTAFLANISHEIRTPLSTILGYSSIIGEDLKELGIGEVQPYVDDMAAAAARLLATLHGIIDLAQLESGTLRVERRPLELRTIIAQHVEELRPRARAKGLSLTTAIDEPAAIVCFDPYSLSRALTHLLDNAIKFTERGEVTVRLWREQTGAVCVEISDTGIGMDPEYAAKLFAPFSQEDVSSTRDYEGTGIGLALVERFLKRSGATISAASDKGRGSRFRIVFPIEPR
jgi:signal transduction histidine kinase